ncbi:class I SAM-dependent methyltransferase [Leptospira levettii]|uniref:Class I SAM-dependent methyltransferase n=1 Tax=Leptospira levettii TaxID=2023178 RepID=A0AAW5VED1_9LEPT|nr:class I SAM-dependent methyltransferase [Leptospira levettii]MCW7466216.1 class I SAM-dependent methyltransferase [Leptospira levettii]MCW7512259.1 class I SAM-dependent methyltransferase [Leptospira levettii]MCW7516267.1 class I SAM-dependent methyltransferase [Leptospira levettii]
MEKEVYSQFYKMEESNWWFRGTRMFLLGWIRSFFEDKKLHTLDVGCGTGIWLSELTNLGDATGLDISEDAYRFCLSRGLKIEKGSVENIPFKDNQFDLVTAIGVIEHVDDVKSISEIWRILKKGGAVVILTSAFESLWSAHDEIVHHKRRYKKSEIVDLLTENGFEIKKVSYLTSILFPFVWIIRFYQRIIKWNPRPEQITDTLEFPSFINTILYSLLRLEFFLEKVITLPPGVNIVAVAVKK